MFVFFTICYQLAAVSFFGVGKVYKGTATYCTIVFLSNSKRSIMGQHTKCRLDSDLLVCSLLGLLVFAVLGERLLLYFSLECFDVLLTAGKQKK